jgi:hypothetical protein
MAKILGDYFLNESSIGRLLYQETQNGTLLKINNINKMGVAGDGGGKFAIFIMRAQECRSIFFF